MRRTPGPLRKFFERAGCLERLTSHRTRGNRRDEGEAETIALGQELRSGLLLLDNREPRLFAKSLNLRVMGTLGVLKLAWLKGQVSDPVGRARELRRNGFWLDERLISLLESDVAARRS